jgi:hypothetical protein
LIAASGEVLEQFVDVPGWIDVCGTGRVDAIGDAIVAVLPPSVERRGIVVGGVLSVAQVPPHD